MLYIIVACCFTAGMAAWERRRIVKTFEWQLCLAALVFANGMMTASAASDGAGIVNCVFALVLVSILSIASYGDIKMLSVETLHLRILLAFGALCTIWNGPSAWICRMPLFLLLFIILSLLARREKSGIGSADAKIIAVLALFMHPGPVFSAVFYALAAGLVYGIVLILRKKVTMKTSLPFIPFIWIGIMVEAIF